MLKENPKTYRRAKRAYRFSQKVLENIEKIKIPEKIEAHAYKDFKDLAASLETTFRAIDSQRRQWFPRISPIFFFNRRKVDLSLRRIWQLILQIREFLGEDFRRVKAVEESFTLIDGLYKLYEQLGNVKLKILKMEKTEESHQKKMDEVQKRILSLRNQSVLVNLTSTNNF